MNSKTKAASGSTKKGKKYAPLKFAIKTILFTIRILLILVISISVTIAGIGAGATFAWIKKAERIPPDQLMLQGFTTKVYDSDNNMIVSLRGSVNREWVDFKDIPQDLKDAFVSIEDKRFYDHPGIDVKRIVNAVLNFFGFGSSSAGGGSTITQQVVKNLTGKDRRSVERKVQEWWIAMDLESNLSKQQILGLYMNLIYMGENCNGVQSAAKVYFNKDVSELPLAECASLAGITNWPRRDDPFTTKGRENNIDRQKIILSEMLDQEYITKKEYDTAIIEELQFAMSNRQNSETSNQSYFVDQVVYDVKRDLMAKGYSEKLAIKTIYNDGLEIYTTQATEVQK